jgi:hypothetical protein
MNNINVELYMSKINSTDETQDGNFRISITDTSSRVQFIEITLKPEDLAYMLSSSTVNGKAKVRKLDAVGKELVKEKRSLVVPNTLTYNKEELRKHIIEEEAKSPDFSEWKLDLYLNSQSSIIYGNDHCSVHYTRYKYV